MNLYSSHTPYTKIKVEQWSKQRFYDFKTLKPLEEQRGINLHYLGVGNRFLDVGSLTTKAWATKEKEKNCTSSKLKPFGHQRTLSRKWKESAEW